MLMIYSLFEVIICLNMCLLLFACNCYWVQFVLLAFLAIVTVGFPLTACKFLVWAYFSIVSHLLICYWDPFWNDNWFTVGLAIRWKLNCLVLTELIGCWLSKWWQGHYSLICWGIQDLLIVRICISFCW